ncbi:Ankyrin repeat domain-containing protein [Plasmodiophora brassicae]|uniref:Uncharacterized protein n=1 Tax=Plasmodiophora brassicae TaxID=37360 RepID=A0A0G4IGT4_PLABS|nr:hypothetical protein PBRA_000100 [Plasmodiophora brassicae]
MNVKLGASALLVVFLPAAIALNAGQALERAIADRDLDGIVELVEMGIVEANIILPDGDTPLHIAAELDDLPGATVLIEYGADTNARDMHDQTPLHRAAKTGSEEVATLLLRERSTEVNARDRNGQTALHLACREGNRIVGLLFDVDNIDLMAVDKHNKTPMQLAKLYGHSRDIWY